MELNLNVAYARRGHHNLIIAETKSFKAWRQTVIYKCTGMRKRQTRSPDNGGSLVQ